jgi:hypothetical protein
MKAILIPVGNTGSSHPMPLILKNKNEMLHMRIG